MHLSCACPWRFLRNKSSNDFPVSTSFHWIYHPIEKGSGASSSLTQSVTKREQWALLNFLTEAQTICYCYSFNTTNQWLQITVPVSLFQRLCSLSFKKAQIQNVRVWNKERFIDWEGINQEDGRSSGFSDPINKPQSSGLFYAKRRENGRCKSWLTTTDIWVPAGIKEDFATQCESESRSSWKSLINNILPLSPQATCRISLMISMSICKIKQKLLAGGHGNRAGLNKMESEKLSVSFFYACSFYILKKITSMSLK